MRTIKDINGTVFTMSDRTYDLVCEGAALAAPRCKCGEPEDGGEFGWFDHEDGNTYCNACGAVVA